MVEALDVLTEAIPLLQEVHEAQLRERGFTVVEHRLLEAATDGDCVFCAIIFRGVEAMRGR